MADFNSSLTGNQIESRLKSVGISVFEFGAKGDGVTDDTAAFNAGLASLTKYQTLEVPYTDSEYIITSQLTEPTVDNWSILGVGGMPIIDIKGITAGDGLIPMTGRRASIENIRIEGHDTANYPDINTGIVDNLDGTYTVTTTGVHNVEAGDSVVIHGAEPAGLNGMYVVASDDDANNYSFTKVTGTGNSTVHGFTRYYVVNGILLGNASATANLRLHNVTINACNNALVFNNSQDSIGLTSITCNDNNIDVLFEGNQSTSNRFKDCSFLSSEQSVVFDITCTDIDFYGCTFAAQPYAGNAYSKNVNVKAVAVFGLRFTNGRFEVNDTNASGSHWDNLYLEGPSSTYPTQHVDIKGSYFTGAAEHHIVVDRYVENSIFEDILIGVPGNTADLAAPDTGPIPVGVKIRNFNRFVNNGDATFSLLGPIVDLNWKFRQALAGKITLNKTLDTKNTGSLISSENTAATRTLTLPAAKPGLEFAFLENSGNASILLKLDPATGELFRDSDTGTPTTADHILTLDSGDTTDTYITLECYITGEWLYTIRYGAVTSGIT